MKRVYLVICNGIVSDEAYSTFEGVLNFISTRTCAPKCLDDVKIANCTYSFGDYTYRIVDVIVV